MKVELDLSHYVRRASLKGATGVDTSTLVSKTDLACLKTNLDNLDIDKLSTVLDDLSNLSNVVNNDVVKKTVCGKLVVKVNTIDAKIPGTSGFVTKT